MNADDIAASLHYWPHHQLFRINLLGGHGIFIIVKISGEGGMSGTDNGKRSFA